MMQLEGKQIQVERELEEIQRKYKQLQQENKEEKQKYQSLESKVHSLEKKVQVKEQSTFQREKRAIDKLHQVQAENSRILKDYNDFMEKMEAQQKVNQNTFKTKEKNLIEEKLKFKEEIDELKKENKKMKNLLEDIQSKSSSQTENERELINRLADLEIEHEKSLSTVELQKTEL